MPRLIDAEKLKAHYSWWAGGSREMTMDEAKKDFDVIIDLQPTCDPYKHGEWLVIFNDDGSESWMCSVCCEEWEFPEGHPIDDDGCNYCPNCGAKMDGERKEE